MARPNNTVVGSVTFCSVSLNKDAYGYRRKRGAKCLSCDWVYDVVDDYYSTDCGNAWQFISGTVQENNIKYCPYCGKPIKEITVKDEENGE